MRFEFSESSYGHVITSEVERHLCTKGQTLLFAPHLPTLREERKLGYDLKLESQASVVVLQFKLGEHVKRSNRHSPTWWQTGVGQEHYRITFAAGHHQLGLMQKMEAQISGGSQRAIVRYIAPGFHTAADFNTHYTMQQVIKHSYYCKPSRVPLDPVNDHHLVHVPTGKPPTQLFSDPIDLGDDDLVQELHAISDSRVNAHPQETSPDTDVVPEVVLAIERVLRDHVESLLPEFDVGFLDRRAADYFADRPDLRHASVAIEIANALGLSVGFTANRR